ncbi:glycoside hydrolase family 32 protein [Tautonia sociabilis]|uniref:beta-fructofuranosidase n=1 Tax=Tautonia sociabilis TaxID=2080755 RepID=A0A432MK44_9BACT|nr:glycoside hydrolase family 32 protein [Tautonia sociabilis]RUL87771.1 hypothetical protein TsocGM_10435 [Tautonia sociabilis]
MPRPHRTAPAVLLAALLIAPPTIADEPVVLADFEGPDYGPWTSSGAAFGPGPARGALPGQMSVSGFLGEGLVNSFHRGDGTTGTLSSPEFTIDRDLIWFLIGGGGFEGTTCIELIVDGRVVRSATGPNTEPGGSELLLPRQWDVRDLLGKVARIRIVDEETGGWGHINVDHIVLCDEPPELPDERDELLARAQKAVAEAADRLGADPTRPAFHFRPPAQWMNDPNGTIHVDGSYHLFYQHNPYGDRWGHMHWGHSRSTDLVHWEHLPIALWPSQREGEEHVFSGCSAVNGDGELMLFYTSVGPGRPNEQWAALPTDASRLHWEKHPGNPLLTTRMPDGTTFGNGMRDPFIFRSSGRTFMVVGADSETEAVIPIFEAADRSLSNWEYKGILWRSPKSEMEFPECPNFFPLGGKFVLLNSPYRPVEYRVGTLDLDTLTFSPETEGRIDQSGQFYASNIATAPDGRCILFGWVRGFPEGRGWNGCLALPRELSLGPDNRPRQAPVRELEALRGRRSALDGPIHLSAGEERPIGPPSDRLELRVRLGAPGPGRLGLRLLGEDGQAIAEIVREGRSLTVAGETVPIGHDGPIDLTVFVDRTVLEVFADGGRFAATRVIPFPGGTLRPSAFAEGGEADLLAAEAWELAAIWPDAAE